MPRSSLSRDAEPERWSWRRDGRHSLARSAWASTSKLAVDDSCSGETGRDTLRQITDTPLPLQMDAYVSQPNSDRNQALVSPVMPHVQPAL